MRAPARSFAKWRRSISPFPNSPARDGQESQGLWRCLCAAAAEAAPPSLAHKAQDLFAQDLFARQFRGGAGADHGACASAKEALLRNSASLLQSSVFAPDNRALVSVCARRAPVVVVQQTQLVVLVLVLVLVCVPMFVHISPYPLGFLATATANPLHSGQPDAFAASLVVRLIVRRRRERSLAVVI